MLIKLVEIRIKGLVKLVIYPSLEKLIRLGEDRASFCLLCPDLPVLEHIPLARPAWVLLLLSPFIFISIYNTLSFVLVSPLILKPPHRATNIRWSVRLILTRRRVPFAGYTTLFCYPLAGPGTNLKLAEGYICHRVPCGLWSGRMELWELECRRSLSEGKEQGRGGREKKEFSFLWGGRYSLERTEEGELPWGSKPTKSSTLRLHLKQVSSIYKQNPTKNKNHLIAFLKCTVIRD